MTDKSLERQVGVLVLTQRRRSKLTRKQTEIITGIDYRALMAIERGDRMLRYLEAIKLCSAFMCRLEDFRPSQDN